jgi:hypothetical protein
MTLERRRTSAKVRFLRPTKRRKPLPRTNLQNLNQCRGLADFSKGSHANDGRGSASCPAASLCRNRIIGWSGSLHFVDERLNFFI